MLRLELKNFRCWEKKSLDIPNNGIVLLNGNSGKGKSSILNSILYALTGKLKNISTFGKKSTTVELELDNMKIIRSRGPNKLSVYISNQGKDDIILYENDEAQSIINSVFGKEFTTVSYIDQLDKNSFIFLSPSEKMEFLENLLLKDFKVDDIKEKINMEINNSKDLCISEIGRINVLEELLTREKKIENENLVISQKDKDIIISSKNFEKILEKTTTNLSTSEKNQKICLGKLRKLEEESLEFIKTQEKKKSIELILKTLENQLIQTISPETNETFIEDNYKQKIDVLEYQTKFYLEQKEYLKYKQIYDKYEEKYNQNKVILDKLRFDIPDSRVIIKYKKAIDLMVKLMEMETKMDNRIEVSDDEIQNLEKGIVTKRECVRIYEQSFKCYNCPKCKSLLKLEDKELILFSENTVNVIDIKEITDSISLDEKKLSQLQRQQITNDNIEKEYNELFDKYESFGIKIQYEDILKEVAKYNDIYQKIKTLEDDSLVKQLESDLENTKKVKKPIYAPGYELENNNFINSEEEFLDSFKKIASLKETRDQVEKIKKNIEKNKIELSLLESFSENSNFDGNTHKEYDTLIMEEKEKYNNWEEKVNNYRENLIKLKKWGKIEENNQRYDNVVKDIEKSKLTQDNLNKKMKKLIKLRDHVRNAERKSISEFISSLNSHASIYIEHFFPDEDIIINLKTIQESKTGKEKIALNFEVNYRNTTGDISFLSGGERDRVNLAYTLALSELFDNRILMLDECISSLDYETSNKVIETLKEKYAGKLILCVAHQVETGVFDHVISFKD